jgi:hypothetical protein
MLTMDPFTLQRRLYREFVKTRPTIDLGMPKLIAAARQTCGGKHWTRGEDIDWDVGLAKWVAWFDKLLASHPIPTETELLWFEAPSESNEAMTSVSGYPKLRTKAESYGLEASRTWPIDERGNTVPAGLHMLAELETFRTANGLNDDNEDEDAAIDERGLYAIDFCYTLLLVLNGLPQTRLLNSLKARSVAVMLGWVGGGEEVVGQLGADGWGPMRRGKAGPPDFTRDVTLKPGSLYFSIKRYLAFGGDIEARDEAGRTVVMRMGSDTLAQVKMAVAAGADLLARDHSGKTVLHHFGACELGVLRLLIDSGADPAAVDSKGQSVLDRVASDGRCELRHLQLLRDRGARPGTLSKESDSPVHALARSPGLGDASKLRCIDEMLKFWLEMGYSINHTPPGTGSPLWVSLRAHLREQCGWPKGFNRLPDSGHDETAAVLLKNGADPNAPYQGEADEYIPAGATPLMLGRYDDTRLVKALLRHGADPTLRCKQGKTALDYAREAAADIHNRVGDAGVADVITVLQRATAKRSSVDAKRRD